MRLALKVDVDTYDGMRDGVPNLLQLFDELGIKASFFIPFGPDESGKAVFRIFRKKGFLTKMFRTNALKLYGIKTVLRGTLLPAPMIGSSFPEIVKHVIDNGHEIGIHGYNHVLWQDHLLEMDEKEVRDQYDLGIDAFQKIVGTKPSAFAAPAWLCSTQSLKIIDEYGFSYASDTRGQTPFYPMMNGREFKTLQVPSTLPTLDEILGLGGIDEQNVNDFLSGEMNRSGLSCHVHSIHTEVEGTALFPIFKDWITGLKKQGFDFIKINDFVNLSKQAPGQIPKCEVVLSQIRGRAGNVSCQKTN